MTDIIKYEEVKAFLQVVLVGSSVKYLIMY